MTTAAEVLARTPPAVHTWRPQAPGRALVTDPTNAGGLADALYQNGPLGFIAATALFFYLGMREVRRYRETDVQTYRSQIAELKDDVNRLTTEVEALRDQAFEGSKEGAEQRAKLARENARLLMLLAVHQIDPSEGPPLP